MFPKFMETLQQNLKTEESNCVSQCLKNSSKVRDIDKKFSLARGFAYISSLPGHPKMPFPEQRQIRR